MFTCERIEKQNLAVPPVFSLRLTPECIDQYKAGESVNETLIGLVHSVSFSHLFCLAEYLDHQPLPIQLDFPIYALPVTK